jgi:hypothetical protein
MIIKKINAVEFEVKNEPDSTGADFIGNEQEVARWLITWHELEAEEVKTALDGLNSGAKVADFGVFGELIYVV